MNDAERAAIREGVKAGHQTTSYTGAGRAELRVEAETWTYRSAKRSSSKFSGSAMVDDLICYSCD
jgi:hypothetical protein